MSVDFIFKIAAIGMIVAVLNTLLVRSGREDQAMLTTLAGVIVVLLVTVAGAGLLFYTVSKLAGSAFGILGDLKTAAGDTGAYIDLMFKILGISIVTQVVCDVCRDNGASALASQTETAAKILVLSLLLPLFQTVIGIVTGLVK